MRKIVGAINMSIDGYCDHTIFDPSEEVHHHYAELLKNSDAVLYGRITFELMKYWQEVLRNPSTDQSMNDFADSIDKIPKIVFSKTLKTTNWDTAELSENSLKEEVNILKKQSGKDILIGSRSLIIQLLNLNLLDELQLCFLPIIAGNGLQLFENINPKTKLHLQNIKKFSDGGIIHYYTPEK